MISSWLVSKESGEAGQEDESDEMDLGCNYMPVDKSFSSSSSEKAVRSVVRLGGVIYVIYSWRSRFVKRNPLILDLVFDFLPL